MGTTADVTCRPTQTHSHSLTLNSNVLLGKVAWQRWKHRFGALGCCEVFSHVQAQLECSSGTGMAKNLLELRHNSRARRSAGRFSPILRQQATRRASRYNPMMSAGHSSPSTRQSQLCKKQASLPTAAQPHGQQLQGRRLLNRHPYGRRQGQAHLILCRGSEGPLTAAVGRLEDACPAAAGCRAVDGTHSQGPRPCTRIARCPDVLLLASHASDGPACSTCHCATLATATSKVAWPVALSCSSDC